MSLEKYKRKRVFAQTPEPKPKKKSKSKSKLKQEAKHIENLQPLRFVIQKHEASHLHYDFRLEVEGVLKSWAVPKGPSLDPTVKRLAMKVEDHPFDYKDFEGVIPKGNYGAGNVMIWDEGEYAPITNNFNFNHAMNEQLRKGHLSICLYGSKIKGQFNLVRTSRNKEKESWLLMKYRDEFASKKDILKENLSARSGFSMQQIHDACFNDDKIVSENKNKDKKQNKKNIKNKKIKIDLSHTPKIAMPKHIKPMLATLIDKPFSCFGWIFEIKWDGYRIIAYVDNSQVTLLSRNQQNYTEIFSPIAKELAKLKLQAVFDGEMVALDKEGRAHFQLLQQYQKTAQGNLFYYIFDLIWLNGHDLRSLDLLQRKNLLKNILPSTNHLAISDYVENEGEDFFKAIKNFDIEGIVAKNTKSEYLEGKRGHDWLKIKQQNQQEAIIAGFTAPRGSRKNIGALILGVYKENELIYIGHVGGGLTEKETEDLKIQLDKIVSGKSPFKIIPKTNMPVTWVKPKLVCEIAFKEWTDEGYLRFPIFLGLRKDKKLKEVIREYPKEIKDNQFCSEKASMQKNNGNFNKFLVSKEIKKDNKILNIESHQIKLTHLNKVYWPDEGYQKKDLINYYYEMAEFILPHLQDRPLSLNRHPEGIDKKNFFQKNYEDAPAWIAQQKIHSKHEDRDINYLICQDLASLLYIVNLGCIEINPWLSRIPSLDYPDYCVFDLDPEDIEFAAVIESALAIHEVLEAIDAKSFCKTSGATGIHIYVPLGRKYNYDQAKQFVELIVNMVNVQLPKITSVLRLPKNRQKKVYLDFLQNRPGQTLAAPYSVRPRKLAPVSTPLFWEEVNNKLNPAHFTMKNIQKRLNEIGDIWQNILHESIDLDRCLKKLGTIYNSR